MATFTSNTFSVTVPQANLITEDTLIEVYPLSMWFRAVEVGNSDQQTIYIHNPSAASITLNSDTMSNSHYVEGTAPTTIAPGASATITVTFTPESGWSAEESGTYTLVFSNGQTKVIRLWSYKLNSTRATSNVTAGGTLSSAGTRYILQNDINESGTAFTITAACVELDLNGFTVNYGSGGATAYGVNFGAGATGSRVTNGTITQYNYPSNSGQGSDGHAINCGAHDCEFDNLNLNVSGFDAQTIRTNWYGDHIHHNTASSKVASITSRHSFDGYQFFVGYSTATGRPAMVHHNTLSDGPQGGMVIKTPGGQIWQNTVSANSTYSNDFCIMVRSDDMEVFNNTIDVVSGRGVFIGQDNQKVYRNTITVTELAQNDEYGGCELGGAYGIQLEGESGVTNSRVYHNTVTAKAIECECICLQMTQVDLNSPGNYIFRNTFKAVRVGSPTANARIYGLASGGDSGATLENNVCITDDAYLNMDWSGGDNFRFYKDQLSVGSNPAASIYFIDFSNGPSHPSPGNEFVDLTFDTITETNNNDYPIDGGSHGYYEYKLVWTLTIQVNDSNGDPISGATVTIDDDDATQVFSDTTGASGQLTAELIQRSVYNDGSNARIVEAETPHQVTVSADGYQTDVSSVTMDSTKTTTITLADNVDSLTDGVLTLDIGGAATGQIHFGWSRPTQNTDASALRDLRSFKIYVGTSTGNYDVLQIDTFDTLQKGATECIVTALTPSTTYYVAVAAIDAFGNESSKSTEQSFTAATPSTPSRSYTDISSTPYTISSSGDYRLTANLSGKITVSVDDVYLYGNGYTITYDTDNGIEISGARDNIEIDSVTFSHSGGAADCIYAASGWTNSKVHHCYLQGRNPNSNGINHNSSSSPCTGSRFYANTWDLDAGDTTGTSRTAMMVQKGTNYKSFGNTINVTNAGRDGGYSNCDGAEIWGDTVTFTAPMGQGTHVSAYLSHNVYVHDNVIDSSANTSGRAIHTDGGLNWLVLHNTLSLGAGTYGTSIRGASGTSANNCCMGYNTIDGNGNNAAGMRWGGNELATVPNDMYGYENSVTNCAGNGFHFYGQWDGNLVTWNNTVDGEDWTGVGDPMGDWYSNNDSISGTIETQSGYDPWYIFNSFTAGQVNGPTTHITFTSVWTGYDGNSDTPNAPTSVVEIS